MASIIVEQRKELMGLLEARGLRQNRTIREAAWKLLHNGWVGSLDELVTTAESIAK